MDPVPAFEAPARIRFPSLSPVIPLSAERRSRAVAANCRNRRRHGTSGGPRGPLRTRPRPSRHDTGAPDTVTAVVTVTDDGGSSGRLRRDFGVLPPGDIRNCLAALAETELAVQAAAAAPLRHRRRSARATRSATCYSRRSRKSPVILPKPSAGSARWWACADACCQRRARTCACARRWSRDRFVTGETAIVAKRLKIRRLSLEPSPRPLPDVLRALVNADGIVVGPGSLYTSILPNLLVEGIASTIYGVNAVRIYVANLMTEPGETDHYTLDDHLRAIQTARRLRSLRLHPREPPSARRRCHRPRMRSRERRPVKVVTPLRWAGKAQVVECDLAVEYGERKIRHQPASVARAIRALVRAGRAAECCMSNPWCNPESTAALSDSDFSSS